jgi:hypothetical protein
MQIVAVSWGWAVFPVLIAFAILGVLVWFISSRDRG